MWDKSKTTEIKSLLFDDYNALDEDDRPEGVYAVLVRYEHDLAYTPRAVHTKYIPSLELLLWTGGGWLDRDGHGVLPNGDLIAAKLVTASIPPDWEPARETAARFDEWAASIAPPEHPTTGLPNDGMPPRPGDPGH